MKFYIPLSNIGVEIASRKMVLKWERSIYDCPQQSSTWNPRIGTKKELEPRVSARQSWYLSGTGLSWDFQVSWRRLLENFQRKFGSKILFFHFQKIFRRKNSDFFQILFFLKFLKFSKNQKSENVVLKMFVFLKMFD